MKIQCVLCKEIVDIGRFESAAGGIEIRCAACGDGFFLPLSGDRSSARRVGGPPPPTGEGGDDGEDEPGGGSDCPKCGEGVRDQLPACPSCGLLRERFNDFARGGPGEDADDLEALWAACEESWSETSRHDRFVEAVASSGRYAYAARRYREATRRRPADPVATARLERISRMAEAALILERTARPSDDEGATPYKGAIILLMVLLLAGAGLSVYLFARGGDEPPRRPGPAQRAQ
jgi:hypothetical protein